MKAFLEVTQWADKFPNHVYFLNDSKSKMYAYVRHGTKDPFKFKKAIGFDIRGRKFVEVPNSWKFQVKEEKPEGRVWTVTGSRGDEYKVSELNGNYSCTCSGFRFRGDCKHIKMNPNTD